MRNRFLPVGAFLFCLVIGMSDLLAQTPPPPVDENPTANTGALKSQIETGGSYDAHTGNMTRVIPDLHVPGALGVYGLDFTRYYNSLRYDRIKNLYLDPAPEPSQPADFGAPGWSHSWRWSAEYEQYGQEVGGDGGREDYYTRITITFPDGRASKYQIYRSNEWILGRPCGADPRFGPPYYAACGERNWSGGFRDYLAEMAEDGSEFWLYRADGGSVHFTGGPWGYKATEVYDRHGFKTTLTYDANWQLQRVEQEVGGRYLNLTWQNGKIWKVQGGGSGGSQTVTYNYPTGGLLSSVTYPGEPIPAKYTYLTIPPPTGFRSAGPLLATADDPHFEGAMTKIAYSYAGSGCLPQGQPEPAYQYGERDYYYASPTTIKEEKHINGTLVSRFDIGCFDGTRMEYNGLGGFREFFFGHSVRPPGNFHGLGYQLAKLTDFTHIYPLPASLPFEGQNWLSGHPRQIWDGRGILTEAVHTDGSGFPSEVRHVGSDGSVYKYDRVNPTPGSSPRDVTRIRNPYNHWLFSKTDERGLTTTYKRDARRRITQIAYPGGSTEQFTYDDLSCQVKTHTLPSGAVETKTYYPPGHAWQYLLWKEWNSVDGGEPNAKIYTYDNLGRVATVSEPRNRFAVPAKDFSTRMTYNARHQVTKVEYAGMLTGTVNPSVSYGYDDYGNCTSITNELSEESRYTYDDYRRCTSYTEPLNAPDWKGGPNVLERTWNWTYDRVGHDNASISAMAHTSKEWRLQIEPPYDAAGNRRAKVRNYDYNNLLVFEYDSAIQAPNNGPWTYPADAATHSYTYDENGQKKTYTDPRSRVTTYDYDLRNRLWKTNETVNTIPRTTETLYDETGNKTLVKFPDTKTQQWLDYDAFGQPGRFIDERNNTTSLTYQWGPMKKLQTVTTYRDKDGGGTEPQRTTFYYNHMGLPQTTVFPDASEEWSFYEFGQLKHFWTRKSQIKTINYDARGREISHSWVGDAAPAISRSWDNANRLTSISNLYSTIDYTYDDAGQVITEGNTITGASAGRRQTTYWRYPNGVPAHITYPNGWRARRDYTYRGQLETTGTGNASGVWTYKLGEYAYFNDGKVQTETAYNGVQTHYGYDGRGQIRATNTLRVSTTPDQRYSYRTYIRDTRDRISAWYKSNSATYNELENGRGDRYGYDAEGQLTAASYEALTPAGTPTGAKRTESFVYDALGNRKGLNVVAGRGAVTFYRTDNGLNQYTSWTPSIINYDDDVSGPPGNGVMMQEGNITAFYNALNQPTTIFGGTLSAGMNFGFDPLGRCVKRWVSASSAPTTNPATYLYYDGWNLIQEGTGAAAAERIYLLGNGVDRIVCHYNYAHTRWRYHHYDARGHCILVTDPNGTLIEQYEYDAFGRPYFYNASNGWASDTGDSAFGNRFLFTGREWLSDLKLYDYRHRLYQPELGRFLQPDPIQFKAGDYNLYRYCHNDPVNKTDPDGLAAPLVGVIGKIVLDEVIDRTLDNVRPHVPDQHKNKFDNARKVYDLIPKPGKIAKNLGSNALRKFSDAKRALVDMAKRDKKTGMTSADMKAYQELNKELPDPFPANKVRGPEVHPGRGPNARQPHGHVGPVDHIPIDDPDL